MSQDRATDLAAALLRLGVSRAAVVELLSYPYDVIERQLAYLPYRKARRPSAFIVDAIRYDYSPPKEAYYAKAEAELPGGVRLDQGSEPSPGPPDAVALGHGAPGAPGAGPADLGLEPGGEGVHLELPPP